VDAVGLFRRNGFSGDREAHTELQRLQLRAARQTLAGDPCRETEVVFDLGTGACLSARSGTLNHNGAESLRRRIDSSRETRRASADDRHVVDRVRIGQLGNA
jgi:hypothetical protein